MRRYALTGLVLVTAAACGASDGSGAPDAGNGNGNGEDCEMAILPFNPAEPDRGDTVIASGDIAVYGDISGIRRYRWEAEIEGQVVDLAPRDEQSVEIEALRAGIYDVRLAGSVGQHACFPASATLNVRELGAESVRYRLRVVPPEPGAPAELEVVVYGGADYDLGPVVIDPGAALTGAVAGPDGPISGYVRVRGASGGAVEGFADEDGLFEVPQPAGGPPYELLVVPDDPAVAPASVVELSEADLADVQISAGIEITGAVVDSSDEPVGGARVTISVDGVPSTVAETATDGSFLVRARPGEGSVRIKAPAGSGLFDLRADGVAVESGADLFVAYEPLAEPVAAAPQAHLSDGETPAPGARAIWIAEPDEPAAKIDIDPDGAGHEARGSVRRTATAGEGGAMPELLLPNALYTVVLTPGDAADPDHAASVSQHDLDAGAPPSLSLAPPAELRGTAAGADAEGLEGVKVVASPADSLARAAGASATSIADDEGAFSLLVTGGGAYELALVPPPGTRLGRAWVDAAAPGPEELSELGSIELPEAIAVRGQISELGSGSIAGAHLSLRCTGCSDERAAIPVAETTADAAGRFVLMVPDPGVADD